MGLLLLIPYYKNSEACEVYFKKLMKTIEKHLDGNIYLIIYEDGQISDWLKEYMVAYPIIHAGSHINKGVSYARNFLLNTARAMRADWIMFLDSDDMIDCDFIPKMYATLSTQNYDMIISRLIMNKTELIQPARTNVAGICLRVEFINELEFDETLEISEDSVFIQEVYKRNPRIANIDSNYYYNYGVNEHSLMKRFERSEIGIKRNE